MGSAESSTLQSVDSLSTTLDEINKKLIAIEDIHLHHERVTCTDETIIIHGKRVKCYSAVNIVVGPIVGLIGENFIRYMLEINRNAELTVNVFSTQNDLVTETRFCFSTTVYAVANKPNVWNIENLLPNTNYIMYIGGLNQSDTLLKHIKISTLPNNPKYSLNCLMGYKGRVDRVTPGDIDIWRSLEYTAVNTIVSNDVDGKSESKSIPDEHVSSNTIYNQSSVHYMMHLGDFLSIEDILRKGSLELLDAVIRYDTSESLWVDLLDQLEVDVRNAYRKALSNPVLANLFRHCGHIFLCGASEAGMATTSFLAMLPTRQTPLSDSATGQTERADNTSGLKSVSASRGSLVSGARSGVSTATSTANRSSSASGSRSASRSGSPAKSPSKAAQAAKLALQRKKLAKQEAAMENEENEDEDEEKNVEDEGEKQESFVEMDEESEVESEDDEVPEDHIIPMVGNLVRKEKEKLYKSVISHTAAQEELRHLITAAVVRLSRRVHYAYMRQLWDSVHYDAFVKQDEHDEVIHRKIILLRRALQRKRILHEHLEKSWKRLRKNFGKDSVAASKVGQRCKDTAKSLARSEKELRDLLSVSVLGGSYKAPVGGSVVNLRSFMVIILENSFSWLNREGQLQDFPLTTREVAISPELLMDIEEGLFGYVTGRRKVVKQGDVDGEDQPQGTVVMDPDAVYGGVKPMNNDAPSLIGMSIDPSGNGIAHTSGGDPNLVAMGNVDGLKTVMCLSPTMLVSDNNRTHPDNSYSLDMPQMFYYSSLDTKKLFHLLGHWQVEDLKRSVLVAAACNVTGCDPTTTSPFSADGWICHTETLYEALIAAKPGAGELDANDEDRIAVVLELANSDELTEKWHGVDGIGRSMIRQVAVGSMSLARRNLGLRAGLNRPMNPKNLSCIDITAEVTSIYGQLCVRRNVWEVRTHTVQPNRMGECSKLELNPLKDGYGSSLIRNIRDVKRSSNGSVNNHHSSSVITVGPVVGKVTPTTAVVLMDFSNLLPSYHRFNSGGGSNTNYIELVATDAITGMEYSASASFLPSQPLPVGNTAGAVSQSVLFAFDELMPFRPYDLRIASDDGVFLSKLAVLSANTTSGVPVTDASGHVGALILGSFCTPPIMADAATRATAISLTALLMNGGNPDIEYREDHGIGGINRDMAMYSPEEVMLMKSLRNVAQDRASAGDGYHANNMLPNAANNANLFGLNNDSSYVMNPRQMQMQTLLSTAGGGDADGGVIAMATSSSPCYYYRILVVGANRPNWLPHNYTDTNLNGTASGCSSAWCGDDEVTLGHQRGYLEESLKLCGAVNNMLGSSSYNIIDLVLHVGCSNVDLSVTIMEVIKLLTKAEELLYFDTYYSAMNVNHTCPAMHSPANANVSQRGNPATGSVGNNGSTVAGLLLQAKEMLRHAYSLHWGSNALMKNHLSHGSHMFVSSPMVELITVLNSASLHTLCRELSHYTTSQLLSIITDVDFEFQQRLWRSPDSTLLTLIGKSGSSSANAMNATGSAVANATTGMSPSLEAVQSCDYIHYVGDGSIAVFVIKLRLVPQFTAEAEARNSNPGTHHNSASFDDTKCLIGNEQLLMLEKILMEKVHFIKTLIVVSPIAVFSESNSSSFVRNSGHKDGSYKHEYLFSAVLGGSGGSINYNVIDISRLLDIVFHWKARVEELKQMQAQRTTDGNVRGSEMDPPSSSSGAGSDVIFICGGEGIGVTTTIECTLNSHGGGGGNFHVASMGIGAFPSQSFVAHQLSSYVDPVMGQRSGAQPSVVTVENENSMFPVHGEGNEVVPGENVGQEQSHVRKVASYDLKIQQLCVGSFMSVPGEGLDDILASAAVPIVISEQQALLEQQALQQNSHEEVEAGGGLEEDSNKEVALDPEPQNEQQEEMLPDENAEVDDSGEEPDVADRSDPPVGGLGVGFAEEVEYQEEPRPVSSSNRKTTSSRPVTGNVNFDANPSIPSASLLPNVSCWQCISPFTHIQYSFRHTSVQYHPHCALVEVNHSAPVSPLSQNYPMQQPDNDRMHPDQGLDGMLPESHIDEGGPEPVQGLLPGYGYSNNLHNNISILERASNVLNKDLVSRINREVTRGGGGSIPTLGGSYLHQQAFSAASMFNNDHTRSNPNAHPHPPQYARIALLDTSSVEALSSVIGDLSMLPIDVANMWAQAAELTRLTDDELINVAQQSGFDLEQSSSYVTMPTTNAAPGDRENEEAASDLLNFKKESDKSRDLLHGALTNGDIRIVALAVRKFCRQYTEVFYACHESFSNNEFGLLHGKHISIAIFTLSNIVQWLINHLPNDVVNMIPYPSSLVIRLVWLKFVQPYNTITDQVRSDELALAQDKEAMAALGNGGSTVETTGEDVFNSMLVADRSYFYRFFMQLFECSALMEQLAFIEGLNDGWM